MKLRYYLRGLGVGILVTAVIMTVALSKKQPMTDDEVIKRAKELGMIENTIIKDVATPKDDEEVKEEIKEESQEEIQEEIPEDIQEEVEAPDLNIGAFNMKKEGGRNSNERILQLHNAGKSNVAIAKELGLGIGEVKLVIDLFEGM